MFSLNGSTCQGLRRFLKEEMDDGEYRTFNKIFPDEFSAEEIPSYVLERYLERIKAEHIEAEILTSY